MKIKGIYFIRILLVVVLCTSCDRELMRSGFPGVITISAEDMENVIIFTGDLQKYDKEVDEAGFMWQCNGDPASLPGFKVKLAKPGSGQIKAEATFSVSSENKYTVRAYAKSGETTIFGEKLDFQPSLTLPCQLLKIEPASAFRGDTINLIGKGFNMTLQYNRVLIEGRNSQIIEANDTVLRCIVPSQTTKGNKPVKIIVNGIEKDFGPSFTLLLPPPPVAVTGEAGNITALSAILTGSVNPNDLPCTVVFEYGLTTSYGQNITASPATVSGTNSTIVSAVLNQLIPGTTYHFRVKAVSESGTGFGDDFSFTTPELPPEPTIQSLSELNVKYGETLKVTGYYFSLVSQVLLGSPAQYIVVNPKSISESIIEIEVYNQQNPALLLGFTFFRVGLVYPGGIKWSDPLNIISAWSRLNDLPANARYKAGCFSLNGELYIGGGAGDGIVFKDFWKFSTVNSTWSRMADIPGVARVYPFGGSNATHGFMGCGFSADNSSKYQLYDSYKYNPLTNTWSQIPDYPDIINNFFFNYSVSINGRPYISLSNTVPYVREIVNDAWVSHPSVTDLMDSPANGVLVIGNSYYVLTGFRTNGIINKTVWEYNTLSGTWTKRKDFPGSPRHSPVFFSIGEYGYYGCGRSFDSEQYKDMWRYDPGDDSWIRIEDFPGGYRSHTISASDGRYGYAGMGVLLNPVIYFKDFWKFDAE